MGLAISKKKKVEINVVAGLYMVDYFLWFVCMTMNERPLNTKFSGKLDQSFQIRLPCLEIFQ